MRGYCLAVCVALFVSQYSIFAQEIEQFSEAQGLPSPYARAHTITHDGSHWLGLGITNQPEGLVRIDPSGKVTHWRVGDAGLKSNLIRSLAVTPDGALWVATDQGLLRWNPILSAFDAQQETVDVRRLAVAPDAGLWAIGELRGKLWAAHVSGSGVLSVLGVNGSCWKDVTLLPTKDGAWWVCESGILWGSIDKGFGEIPLEKTPLFKPASKSVERAAPSVWVHAAVLGPDGSLYVIGHVKTVAKRDPSGAWSTLSDGQPFSDLAWSPPHGLLAAAYDGGLFALSAAGPPKPVFVPEGFVKVQGWRLLAADALGCAWVVWQHSGQSEQVTRWCPGGGPTRTWDLSDGTALSPGVIEAFLDPSGGLWLSTNAGLWHLKD